MIVSIPAIAFALCYLVEENVALSHHIKMSKSTRKHTFNSTVDPAVFVSKYLPDKAAEGRAKSKVSGLNWPHDNYAAFITLDEATNSNMFFWYFESMDGNPDAPLLLWLQGGPGASSLFGLFTEIGPYNIDKDMKISPRAISWNKKFHLLFIDNPLGTGFSFTDSADMYVTNQTTVGLNLYNTLTQFYELFPNLRSNDFYVTGESYAGKYVPACAYTIHEKNKLVDSSQHINLQGISIGDGAFDPPGQFHNFGEMLWYLSMLDQSERLQFDVYETKMKGYLESGDVVKAFGVFDEMLNGDFFPYPTYYANVTGMGTNYFNFELGPGATSLSKNFFIDWLDTPAARNAIHVGDYEYAVSNGTVEEYLLHDWMVGVIDMLVPLMENYKTLIYNGQNDVILAAPLTEQSLRKLKWSGQSEYLKASKSVWKIPLSGDEVDIAGYTRVVGNFTQAVVRGAGHMVPGDQPARAYDLIDRFINSKSFTMEG